MYTDLILNTLRRWIFIWKMQRTYIHYCIGSYKDRKNWSTMYWKWIIFPIHNWAVIWLEAEKQAEPGIFSYSFIPRL